MRVGSGWSRRAGIRRDGERGGHRHGAGRRSRRPVVPRPPGRRRRQGRGHHQGHGRQDRPRPRPAVRSRGLGRRRLRRQDRPQRGRFGRPSRPTSWPRASSPRASSSSCSPAVTTATPPARRRRSTSLGARGGAQQGKTQIVEVATRTREAKERLQGLGLDLTEHGDADSLEVVLHGDADAAHAARRGLHVRRADRRPGGAHRGQPGGRRPVRGPGAGVRRCRAGAPSTAGCRTTSSSSSSSPSDYPALVKPHHAEVQDARGPRRHRHRDHPHARTLKDGKPVFLNMGVHHAREWPSSEHAMEFAYDLADQLRPLGADLRPGRQHAHDHRAAGQRRTASTSPARRRRCRRRSGSRSYDLEYRRKNCRLGPGVIRQPDRLQPDLQRTWASTRTATTAASGAAPGASTNPTRRHLPRRRRRSPSPRSRTSRTCRDAQRSRT